MKIKFYADDKLPQNEAIKILVLPQLLEQFFMKVINIIHKFSR